MKLKSLKCPNCHAVVKTETGVATAICEYCGSTVIVQQLTTPAAQPPSGETRLETLKLQLARAFAAGQLVDARVLSQRLCRDYPTEWEGWLSLFKLSLIDENEKIEKRILQEIPQPKNQFNNALLEKAFVYMEEDKRIILQNIITRRDTLCQTLAASRPEKGRQRKSGCSAAVGALLFWVVIAIVGGLMDLELGFGLVVLLLPLLFLIIPVVAVSRVITEKLKHVNMSVNPQLWNDLFMVNREIINF